MKTKIDKITHKIDCITIKLSELVILSIDKNMLKKHKYKNSLKILHPQKKEDLILNKKKVSNIEI